MFQSSEDHTKGGLTHMYYRTFTTSGTILNFLSSWQQLDYVFTIAYRRAALDTRAETAAFEVAKA